MNNPDVKRKRILLVDDEPFNLLVLENIISSFGLNDHLEVCKRALNG